MKKIALFKDGSYAVLDSSHSSMVTINGQKPISLIDATEEIMNKYFPPTREPENPVR